VQIGETAALLGVSTRASQHYHHRGLLPELRLIPAATGEMAGGERELIALPDLADNKDEVIALVRRQAAKAACGHELHLELDDWPTHPLTTGSAHSQRISLL
jgi:hypothetical protein